MVKIEDVVYKLYIRNTSDSYWEKIDKWFDSVILPKVGDILKIGDSWHSNDEYVVTKIVYPMPNIEYKVDVYVMKVDNNQ